VIALRRPALLLCFFLCACGPRGGDFRGEARETTAPDGVVIAYETRGAGSPALVFVHGWSCDRSYWREQIGPFSRRYSVVAVDLSGHGESGADRKEFTMATFGEDVAAVVTDLDLRDVVLIGHSMGSDVAVEAARRLEGRVRGVVMVDQYRQFDKAPTDEEIDAFVAPFREDFPATTKGFVADLFGPRADPELVGWVDEGMASAPPAIALPALESTFRHAREMPAALAELDLPVIALNADFSPTDVASLERHGVEVLSMSGVGHFPMLEDPERFNALLAEVIERLPGRVRDLPNQ
jgi:pimeloyl-ACP methyl ester carboxylesterase